MCENVNWRVGNSNSAMRMKYNFPLPLKFRSSALRAVLPSVENSFRLICVKVTKFGNLSICHKFHACPGTEDFSALKNTKL